MNDLLHTILLGLIFGAVMVIAYRMGDLNKVINNDALRCVGDEMVIDMY